MPLEKVKKKKRNLTLMSRAERGQVFKMRIVSYEVMITVFQIAIIIFCFLAYEKISMINMDEAEGLLMNQGLGQIMCALALAVVTMSISLIRFVMVQTPWFKELWKDAWEEEQPEKETEESNRSTTKERES